MLDRIEINPHILKGNPVIKGTRIPVYLILELLHADYNFQEILNAYPALEVEDIKAALEYAAKITKEYMIDIETILTSEEEKILEEAMKELRKGKATKLEKLESERRAP